MAEQISIDPANIRWLEPLLVDMPVYIVGYDWRNDTFVVEYRPTQRTQPPYLPTMQFNGVSAQEFEGLPPGYGGPELPPDDVEQPPPGDPFPQPGPITP